MAARSCKLFFLYLSICCSGTVMGSSYDFRGKSATSSIIKTLSTLVQDKVSHHCVLQSLSIPHLRSHTIPSAIVISCAEFSKGNELQMLLPILRSTNSLLKGLQLEKPLRIAVALPLSLLSSLDLNQRRHLDDVFHFIKETKSFCVVEEFVDGKWNNTDGSISKANLVVSHLSHADVPFVLSIRSSVFPTPTYFTALNPNILRSLDNNYPKHVVELSPTRKLQHSHSSRRKLLTSFLHDSLFPSTTPVTNPTAPTTTIPPYNPAPTVVTVPTTNPASGTPASPASFPITNPVPSTTPVPTVPTTPTTAPVAYPGAQPVTNPVTTYPPPSTVGGVPSTTTPVTTPGTAPAVTNAPVIPGQTWCIAKSGAPETTLQSALDYACGIGGADCSTIQEGASCYNPNTLENHASCAFNSYFQKNPVATSCDFGGAAVLSNTNPSTGPCTFPSSATTASSSTIPPATTASTSGATGPGTGTGTGTGSSYGPYSTPPSVLNASSGPTGSSTTFGYGTGAPIITAPPTGSAVQHFLGFITLVTSLAMPVLLGV